MSINNVKGTLIQPDVNNDNNTTRIMEVDTLYATIISDGIADIDNGYISNLIEPTSDNQIATKYYVDHSAGGGGSAAGPNTSVQYNSAGSFAGSSNMTLTNPGLASATLNLNGSVLTNGTITMSGSKITGVSNPTTSQEAANKDYVDETLNKLGVISIVLEQKIGTIYTPAQTYNNIINLSMNNNYVDFCPVDQLPSGPDMKTFLGSEFQLGKTWTTIFRGPQTGNDLFLRFIGGTTGDGNPVTPITYLFCTIALPVFTVANYSVITLTNIVTNVTSGSELYNVYVTSNFNNITTNARITDRGVYTPSMGSGSLLGNGAVIYPMLEDPTLSSSSPITYTYSDIQKTFIIRSGLTGPTSDTFVSASTFVSDPTFIMGGGTLKFWIQNISSFALTLTPSAGWSFHSGNNPVIPAGYCGAFWVTATVSPAACLVYSMGTNPING